MGQRSPEDIIGNDISIDIPLVEFTDERTPLLSKTSDSIKVANTSVGLVFSIPELIVIIASNLNLQDLNSFSLANKFINAAILNSPATIQNLTGVDIEKGTYHKLRPSLFNNYLSIQQYKKDKHYVNRYNKPCQGYCCKRPALDVAVCMPSTIAVSAGVGYAAKEIFDLTFGDSLMVGGVAAIGLAIAFCGVIIATGGLGLDKAKSIENSQKNTAAPTPLRIKL